MIYLFENKKFAGLILESYNSVKNNKYVIIGIGINFFSSPTIELIIKLLI